MSKYEGHTPGPWEWAEHKLNEEVRACKGKRSKDQWLYHLRGPSRIPAPHDIWDYRRIMQLRWSMIKGNYAAQATPMPADAALIADAPKLLEQRNQLLDVLRDVCDQGGCWTPKAIKLVHDIECEE